MGEKSVGEKWSGKLGVDGMLGLVPPFSGSFSDLQP
jgi:hypothetical protein